MPQHLDLAPEPTSPREARLFVAQWVRSWGYRRILNAAALMTSELATNAVVHGGGRFTVHVANTGRGVRVEVCDGSTRLPELRPPHEIDQASGPPGGRGLHVVDGLASRWGCEADGATGTKRVWFELDAASDASFGWAVGS